MKYETNNVTSFVQTALDLGLQISVETWDNLNPIGIIDVGQRIIAMNEHGRLLGEFLINAVLESGERVTAGIIDCNLAFDDSPFKKWHYQLTRYADIPIMCR